MKTLKQYIPTGTRHKLLFTSYHTEGIEYVDMGALLAHEIESSLLNRHLPLIADDAVENIIKNHVKHNDALGHYIAIYNIGILFEPALRLDLHAKFNSWSKAYTLIVDCTAGTIKNNTFYLTDATDQSYSIDLSDISYKIHYDEI